MSLSFKLQVFEGPLDLLLHLIDKNKINIYDIPIALITDQYLDYVRQMKEEDLNAASEFLVMAATLLDIKSRMLLPGEEKEEEEEETGDPRQELVERLLEYKMVRYLSDELRDRNLTASRALFARPRIPEEVRTYQPPLDYGELLGGTSLDSLQQVFADVLRRQKLRVDPVRSGFGRIKKEEYDVAGRERYVRARIREKGSVSFRALLEEQPGREEIIVTFLVILDMAKTGDILILQDQIFGEIMLVSNGFAADEEEETGEEGADEAVSEEPSEEEEESGPGPDATAEPSADPEDILAAAAAEIMTEGSAEAGAEEEAAMEEPEAETALAESALPARARLTISLRALYYGDEPLELVMGDGGPAEVPPRPAAAGPVPDRAEAEAELPVSPSPEGPEETGPEEAPIYIEERECLTESVNEREEEDLLSSPPTGPDPDLLTEEAWTDTEDRRPRRRSSLPWATRWRSNGSRRPWKSHRKKPSRRSRSWKSGTRRMEAACSSITTRTRSSSPQGPSTMST